MDIESPLITLSFGLGIKCILIRSHTQALQVIVLSWLPIQINHKAAFIQRISFQRLNIQTFGSAAILQIDCNKVVGSGRRKSSRADTCIYPLIAPATPFPFPLTDFVSYRRYANQLLHKNLRTGCIFIVGDNGNITVQLARQVYRIVIAPDAVRIRITAASHFHNDPIGQFCGGCGFASSHLARQPNGNFTQFLHADGQFIQDFISSAMFAVAFQGKAERRSRLIGLCVVNLTVAGIRGMVVIEHSVRAIKGNVISFNLLQVNLNFNIALHVGNGIDTTGHLHVLVIILDRLQGVALVHIYQELQCVSLFNRCRTADTSTIQIVDSISYGISFHRSLIIQVNLFTVTKFGAGNVVTLSAVIHGTVIRSNIRNRHLVHSGIHKSVALLDRHSIRRNRANANRFRSAFLTIQHDGNRDLTFRLSQQHSAHQHGRSSNRFGGNNHKGAERGHIESSSAGSIIIITCFQRAVRLDVGSISSLAFGKVQTADCHVCLVGQFRAGQSNIPHLDVNDFRIRTQSSLNRVQVIICHLGVVQGECGILRQNSRNGSLHTANFSSDFVLIRLGRFNARFFAGDRRHTGRRNRADFFHTQRFVGDIAGDRSLNGFGDRSLNGFGDRSLNGFGGRSLNSLGSRSLRLGILRCRALRGNDIRGRRSGVFATGVHVTLSRSRFLRVALRISVALNGRRGLLFFIGIGFLSGDAFRLRNLGLSLCIGRRHTHVFRKRLDRGQGSQHRKDQQYADHATCLEP